MSRKTSLDRVRESIQPSQGWWVAEATEKTWGEQYTVLYLLDAEKLVNVAEKFQAIVPTDGGLVPWRQQSAVRENRVGFAVRFKENGSIDGAVALNPIVDSASANPDDEDDAKVVYSIAVEPSYFHQPDTRKLSDVESWVEVRSPHARRANEEKAAKEAAEAEAQAAAYQRQKEFILDTDVGKHIAVSLLGELAYEKRKLTQSIQSIQSSCQEALSVLEDGGQVSVWERLNRQSLDEYWEAVHRYNLFHALVHRHPLGDLSESKYASDDGVRHGGGEFRAW